MARRRDLVEILADHERQIRRMQATLARIGSPAAGITDHGALTGLTPDDDHPHYWDDTRGATGAAAKIAADDLYLQTAGDTMTGTLISTLIHGADGSAGSPTYSYGSETNTGHYRATSGVLSTSISGIRRLWLDAGFLHVVNNLRVGAESAFVPWTGGIIQMGGLGSVGTQGSYAIDLSSNWMRTPADGYQHMGINGKNGACAVAVTPEGNILFRADNDFVAKGTGSPPTIRAELNETRLKSNVQIQAVSGTASLPGYGFASNTGTGMWLRSGAQLAITSTASVDNAWFTNVGTYIRTAPSTGTAANMTFDGSNLIQKKTSARKYKSRINYNVDYLADIVLRPAKFYRKDDAAWYYDFIADDLGDQDVMLGVYGNGDMGEVEGEIENYHTNAILAVMAAKINRLDAQVKELQDA